MIEVSDVRKSFTTNKGEIVQAVDGVTFQAPDGRVTGLLGPNGAGKTTALRVIYGLVEADSGTVLVDGIDVAQEPRSARARLGVLPDVHGLYPRLTAREHARYFGQLHGLSRSDLEGRIDALVEKLDMGEIAERRAQGFSHGERMKVSLAAALVHGPNNMLLDEPTNGLDVMSTRAVRRIIGSLRDEGKCVIFSSHIMQEVSALCDSIVMLAHGKVVARGTPDELRELSGHTDLEEAFVTLVGEEAAL